MAVSNAALETSASNSSAVSFGWGVCVHSGGWASVGAGAALLKDIAQDIAQESVQGDADSVFKRFVRGWLT